jgi:pilus assembly protein CpaB
VNTRAFTLALVIAGIAVFMVYTYLEDQKSAYISKYGTEVAIVVAKRDIQELELLDDTMLIVKPVPKSFAAPGSFDNIKALENTMATVPIMAGEQITKPRVTYPGAKTGLSRQVSIGKRAIAIQISERQAVSKLIKPGDRVDILAPIDISNGRKDMQRTSTILQDVLVLSTGKSMTNAIPIYGVKTPREIKKMNAQVYDRYDTVTIELTPYEAQKLVFLTYWTGAKPWLSLRNNNDKDNVRIKSTDIFDVIGEDGRQEAKQYFQEQNKVRGGR